MGKEKFYKQLSKHYQDKINSNKSVSAIDKTVSFKQKTLSNIL